MKSQFVLKLYWARALRGPLLVLGLMLIITNTTYANTVTLTSSYPGKWSIALNAASLPVDNCESVANEPQLKQCIDNDVAANSQYYSIYQPWLATDVFPNPDSLGCTDGVEVFSGIECNWEFLSESSGGFSIDIAMQCLNGGAPNPTIFGDEGAVVSGWCLVLGVAPPPVTTPTCADGSTPSNGQDTCASSGELKTGDPDACQCGGDPINIGSGNMYLKATDYKAGGPFPLEFTRFYNSAVAIQGASPDGADQTLGAGWSSNLTGPHLYINITQQYVTCQDTSTDPPTDYVCPANSSPAVVTVWRPDGTQSVFSGAESSQQAGIPEALVPEPGAVGQLSYGTLPTLLSSSSYTGTGYIYLRNDGYTEFYNDLGQVLMIQSPQGTQQTYTYDSSGRLTAVIAAASVYTNYPDTQSLRIVLTYDTDNRIQTVTKCVYFPTILPPESPCEGPSVYTYTYDANDNLIQVQYPDNSTVKYLYEDAAYPNALTGIIDENSNRYATWGYDAQGRANSSYNGNGSSTANNTNIVYNADGSADVTEPTGLVRHLTFTTVNGTSLLASASEPCTMCRDKSATVVYQDINGDPYISGVLYKTVTDFNGNTTKYVIDPQGRELSKTEAYGTQDQRAITTTWNNTVGMPEQVVLSNGSGQAVKQTTYCYNYSNSACTDSAGIGQVWTVTVSDPINNVSRTTTYTYQYSSTNTICNGALASVKGPRTDVNQTTTYSGCMWDVYHFSQTYTSNTLGQVSEIALNSDMENYEVTDPYEATNPNVTRYAFQYDARQRLISKSVLPRQGSEEVTQYGYDLAGNLIKITLPTGGYIQYGHDTAHRLVSVTDSDNETINYTLDALGNRTDQKVLNSSGATVRERQAVYDNLNRLSQVIGGMQQTTNYTDDPDGNLTGVTDPLSNPTTFQRDPLNRIFSKLDAAGGTTTSNYDPLNHATDVTSPRGLDTHYVYDAFGDVLQESSRDRGVTNYTYDLAGNLTNKTDAIGNIENRTYDVLNRLTQVSYPQNASKNVTYTYDQGTCLGYTTNYIGNDSPYAPFEGAIIGRLICMTDSSGTTAYNSYDWYGNLTGKTITIGSNVFGVGYVYDLSNNITQIYLSSAVNGAGSALNAIIYTRDTLGKITEVDGQSNVGMSSTPFAIAKSIAYEPFGPSNSLKYENGLLETRTFDNDYRLTGISIPAVMGLAYTYDSDDNVKVVTDSVSAHSQSLGQTASYDALNRIGSWQGKYGTITSLALGYDADGDRASETTNGTSTGTYNYGNTSDQLLSITGNGAATYGYDAMGDVTTDATYKYSYDQRERLTSINNAGTNALVATYYYNGLGQRAKKVVGTKTTYFIYDESGHLLTELNGSDVPTQTYIWLGDRPIANFNGTITAATSAFYIHADRINTPRVMTNSSKAVDWIWQSGPFGDGVATVISGSGLNLRLPGQYYDTETGDHYNYFREYSPGTGRYLESDPIGLGGGVNTYAYVTDNPMRFTDPFGLCSKKNNQTTSVVPVPGYKSPGNCIDNSLYNTYGSDAALRAEFFTATNLLPGPNAASAREAVVLKGALVYGPQLPISPLQGSSLAAGAAEAAPFIDLIGALLTIPATWQYLYAYNQCYP